MSKVTYRALKNEQIAILVDQGCTCEEWPQVHVTEDFNPSFVRHVHFSGPVKIGKLGEACGPGTSERSELRNVHLHNCVLHDNVLIRNVGSRISNYTLESGVRIEGCTLLEVNGKTAFGNGVEVHAGNESGSRAVPIYNRLTAQVAYLICFYRYRTALVKNLKAGIARFARSVSSQMGTIGKNTSLIGCGILRNVTIGNGCTLEGVHRLENGSVNGTENAPVVLTGPVTATDFIICSDTQITGGGTFSSCFIGQGCRLGGGVSAEHTLFFANCEGFQGEFCSVFAGPFTVSHHKASLLIAASLSFYNAGSGANQSNHMYRLGPLHQGILRRGCKSGSGAYLLWPSVLDVFSVVKGRHFRNLDLDGLPFSYVIEQKEQTFVLPGANLGNVGLYRDGAKWSTRDRRNGGDVLDSVVPDVFNPFVVQRMELGLARLKELVSEKKESNLFTYGGAFILPGALQRGIEFYASAIDFYLGDCLTRRMTEHPFDSVKEMRSALLPGIPQDEVEWYDIGGLPCPADVFDPALLDLEKNKKGAFDNLVELFRAYLADYKKYEWGWVAGRFTNILGKAIAAVECSDLESFLLKWKVALRKVSNAIVADAEKEFAAPSRIGYGLDGSSQEAEKDFLVTRGDAKKDPTICRMRQEFRRKERLAASLTEKLRSLRE